MLAPIFASSNVLQQYMKHPSSGPRELTPAMVRSIDEANKPAKRGKKPETQKEAQLKKPARRLILQSSSDSDSEYVPPQHKIASPSESESESSDDEASGRGDTPPRSLTPKILVCFHSPSPPPVTIPSNDDDDEPVTKRHLKAINEKLDQLLSSSTSGAYSEAALKALFSSVVTEHSVALSSATKTIEASTSECQQASIAVDASTKECKEAIAKVDKLVSEAHLFLDSLQAAATAKNAQTVNALVENLQRFLQSENSNLEVGRQAIEAANTTLHANVNVCLTQLEAELAVENRIMDDLDRRTSQLKMQNLKLCTTTTELNDLKLEKEVVRSLVADVHSILLHILEAHDPIISIAT
ncbi:unnamed protein product [Lactuca saligna]|uniref:Uncharacterized protein n=1 Tax=Lactuca saligna TaxID=75948 RepID=A0AA36E0I3_LACSI|nr:unnamed protein product [Lactuca saligna]